MPITRAAAAHHAVRTKRQSMAGPETFTTNPLPAANGAIPVVSPLRLEMDPATPRTAAIAGDADYYTGRFWALKGRCRRLYGAPATQGAVAFLILGNFVKMMKSTEACGEESTGARPKRRRSQPWSRCS